MSPALERYAAALAAVPVAYTCSLMAVGAVDVPWFDDWSFVPLLVKAQEGELTPADLWAPHNEHRLVFPRLLMLALALLTGWDLRAGMAASALFALATLLLLHRQARATAAALGGRISPWLPVLLSVLVFSFVQWHNWLWHWQLQIYLCVLASIAGLAVLARPALGWWRLALGAALGVVATLSFGAGFAFWPAAALVLATPHPDDRLCRRRRLAFWAGVTLASVATYLWGLERSPGDEVGGFSVADASGGLLALLGAPLIPGAALPPDAPAAPGLPYRPAGVALALGALACALLPAALRAHARGAPPAAGRHLCFWLALAAFAIGGGLLCAVGRVGERGLDYALQARYTTLASHLWTALAVLLLLRRPGAPPWVSAACAAGAVSIGLLSAASTTVAAPLAAPWAQARALTARRLAAADPDVFTRLAPPLPDEALARHAADLRRLELTCFRNR